MSDDPATILVSVTAKGRGAVARLKGQPLASNPYPADTSEWRAWVEGWLEKDAGANHAKT